MTAPTTDPSLSEPAWLRRLLIAFVIAVMLALIALPLAVVIVEALAQGWQAYLEAIKDPDTQAAIRLTLVVAAISVPLNAVFGIAAAWAVTKYEFAGKRLLLALIDLPFAISPVVAGLVFVLLFGWVGLRAWADPSAPVARQGVEVVERALQQWY